MKFFNSNWFNRSVIALIFALGSASLLADEAQKDRIDPSSRIIEKADFSKLSSEFSLAPTTPAVAGRAVQFRIHYDPSKVQVASLENCLINLPVEIRSGLSSCRDISEKSLVQVVVSDLRQDGRIPANFQLGVIDFLALGPVGSAKSEIFVDDIHVSSPEDTRAEISKSGWEVKLVFVKK